MISVRQFVTLYILRPLAKRIGIRPAKVPRFTERECGIGVTSLTVSEGYAVFYFGIMGVAGIVSVENRACTDARLA